MAGFDLRKLEKELETAVEVEEKRLRVDEIKKRAVGSTRTYEEFRQRVLAADLKAIPSKEFETAFRKHDRVARNRAIGRVDRRGGAGRKAVKARDFSSTTTYPTKPPKTIMEFSRDWRRRCKTNPARFQYIRLFTAKRVAKIFKSEIDGMILGQIVTAMAECLVLEAAPATEADESKAPTAAEPASSEAAPTEEGKGTDEGAVAAGTATGAEGDDGAGGGRKELVWATKLLGAFAELPRFGLTLKLLAKDDKAAMEALLDKLRTAADSLGAAKVAARLVTVREAYGL